MTAFTEPCVCLSHEVRTIPRDTDMPHRRVTSVLTARFLLDIQEASRRPTAAMSTDGSELSSRTPYFSTASWSTFSGILSTPMSVSFLSDPQAAAGDDEAR